jgi:hypothetical protein
MPGSFVKNWALALLVFAFAVGVKAAEVVKVNGEVLTGTIEDLQLNEYVRIRTKDQKLFEVRWDEMRKLNGKDVVASGVTITAETAAPKKEFWQKSWYLNILEVGPARLSYPSDMSAALDTLRDLPGAASPGAMSIQMAGFYWPVGVQKKTLVGFMISGSGDAIVQGNKRWQLNEYLTALSALYFPVGKIGDGLYLRGDVGAASVLFSGSGSGSLEQGGGFGFLTGLGYVMPISDSLRPFVNLNYSLKSIGSGSAFIAQGVYQSGGLDCGLLW